MGVRMARLVTAGVGLVALVGTAAASAAGARAMPTTSIPAAGPVTASPASLPPLLAPLSPLASLSSVMSALTSPTTAPPTVPAATRAPMVLTAPVAQATTPALTAPAAPPATAGSGPAAPATVAATPALVSAVASALAPGAVAGLVPLIVRGARDAGPATAPVHLRLLLPFRDQAGLDALLSHPSDPLSAAEFEARFAPAPATVGAVVSAVRRDGLTVDAVAPNRVLVSVSGSPRAVGTAFGTTLHRLVSPGGLAYVSPLTTAHLPAGLSGQVSAVLGLSGLGRVASDLVPATGGVTGGGMNPHDFWSFYNAPGDETGQGQTIAVLAEGDLSGVVEDLRTFEQTYGLPQVPVTVRKVDGGSSDTSASDEFDLDTQYSTGFAPAVAGLVLYDGASLADPDVADLANAFVSDDSVPQASLSAGECELVAQLSGLRAAMDASLQQAAAQGQTLFTASGDNGGFCPAIVAVNGLPAGLPGVNYPASSPYAIGVGGTSIVNLPLLGREIAWPAGGGGISLLEPQPAFQAGAGGSLLPLLRGVPDVALDADPATGYIVTVNGTQMEIGGTSAGAPGWMGIWARAQGAHGGGLGFAGPVLYREPARAFNDIVFGDDVPWPATPGWDYATGRGTPDITAIVADAKPSG